MVMRISGPLRVLALFCALIPTAPAAALSVVTSGAFTAAFTALVPVYEKTANQQVVTEFGPSMGTTRNAIPMRLERSEMIDVVIMAGPALADLIKQGKVLPDSRVDLVRSKIAMAVKAGAPKPDISTFEAFRKTLLAAKSIAYSDSASGVYLVGTLFPRMGLAEQLKSKMRKIEADPVGEAVARGEFEIGFQQVSELKPVKGIDIVGELPEGAQMVTIFAAGIPAKSTQVDAAKKLIRWLASPAAEAVIRNTGLEPMRAN